MEVIEVSLKDHLVVNEVNAFIERLIDADLTIDDILPAFMSAVIGMAQHKALSPEQLTAAIVKAWNDRTDRQRAAKG